MRMRCEILSEPLEYCQDCSYGFKNIAWRTNFDSQTVPTKQKHDSQLQDCQLSLMLKLKVDFLDIKFIILIKRLLPIFIKTLNPFSNLLYYYSKYTS